MSPEALACWPNRGQGTLPDGYAGSGAAWWRIAQKHKAALVWRIVARVRGSRAKVDAAERRAIRLTRHLWAERCMNIREGGQGYTPLEAQASSVAAWADPDVRSRNMAHLQAMFTSPEIREKHKAARKVAANKPEARAAHSNFMKGYAATPEGHAQMEAMRAKARSPEARAKHRLTKSIRKAERLAALHQPHDGGADPVLGVAQVRPDALPGAVGT